MKNFDKLLIQQITIEVNRQCNFKCEHCFCGESEGFFDFNYEKLCLLLDQTLAINYIDFIGGEPTLSIDIMMNVIKECEKRNIPWNMDILKINDYKLLREYLDSLIPKKEEIQSEPVIDENNSWDDWENDDWANDDWGTEITEGQSVKFV